MFQIHNIYKEGGREDGGENEYKICNNKKYGENKEMEKIAYVKEFKNKH